MNREPTMWEDLKETLSQPWIWLIVGFVILALGLIGAILDMHY